MGEILIAEDNPMKRLERVQRLMKKWGITYVDAIEDYRSFIQEALEHSPSSLLLDACCGSDSSSIDGLNPFVHKIGFDVDTVALKKNTLLHHAVSGDLIALPFKNNSFQIVCLHWGIEHIQDPLAALQEIYRVLNPGGHVVLMTTNTWHPFYFLAKITPHSFHQFVRKKLLEIEDEEAFKTHYRANTPFQMKNVLHRAGFSKIELRYRSNPSVYAFSSISFYLGFLYEKITDFSWFKNFKMFMVACGEKD